MIHSVRVAFVLINFKEPLRGLHRKAFESFMGFTNAKFNSFGSWDVRSQLPNDIFESLEIAILTDTRT